MAKENPMPSGKRIDWSKYDQLIIDKLPKYTIKKFGEIFLPGVCARAIGVRAKKLGVKAAKKQLSNEHKSKISSTFKKEVTKEQVEYIKANLKLKSRKDISKDLNISLHLVNRTLKDLDIEPDYETSKRVHKEKSKENIKTAVLANQEKWKDKEFRDKRSKSLSEQSRKLWESETYRLKVKSGIRKVYDKTDLKERLSEIGKRRYKEDPAVREILSAERDFKNSKLNDDIAIVLEGHKIEFEREFELSNYKMDFKIGNILLEVQGDYWHSLSENVRNDNAKATIIKKYFPQYQLKYIWEKEFRSIRGTKRILELLEIMEPEPERVDLKELSFSESGYDEEIRKFLISYHYLGHTKRNKHTYKLCYNNVPICVAVFGQPVRSNTAKGKVLELVRFCRYPYIINKNMGSYFLAKCIKDIKSKKSYDNLVSFADTRLHDGALYKSTNWENMGKTKPDYEYVSNQGIPIHKKTLYNRARSENKKEREYAESNGYKKVKIGSKIKFLYNLR